MITELEVRNFKSWRNTGEVRLAPLTCFFGPNSSGKTSLFQLLLLLKQTVESPDRKRVLHFGDDRSFADLGTFYDLVWNHEANQALEFSLSWNFADPLEILDSEHKDKMLYRVDAIKFATQIREEEDKVYVESFNYSFGTSTFGMKREKKKPMKPNQYELIFGNFQAKRVPGRPWPLPSPIKCYGFPDAATGYFQNLGFLSDFVLAFEDLFSNILYLGPLREHPKRSYLWTGERPVDVGRRGEQVVAALLAARKEQLRTPRGTGRARRWKNIEERVLEWLRDMGLIHSFSLKSVAKHRKDYEVRVKKSATSSEVQITDVGFGVSQILPVLVLCYYAPESSTIILEQPEIHLHPAVQSDLADVFVEVVKERKVQIIVESHSEHLLRRLQRRIAENEQSDKGMKSNQAALYFCKIRNGESQLEKLELDMFGAIKNWPKDFFGDEMGELSAMTEAAMKRRASNKE